MHRIHGTHTVNIFYAYIIRVEVPAADCKDRYLLFFFSFPVLVPVSTLLFHNKPEFT